MQTMEELMDVYLQFQLYYSDDISKMQDWFKEKEKKAKKSRKKTKTKGKKKEKEKSGEGSEEGEKSKEGEGDGGSEGEGEGENEGKKKDGLDESVEKDENESEEKEEKDDEEKDGEESGSENENDDEDADDDDVEDEPKQTRKNPRRRDFYTICRDNGLIALTKKFGLLPEQFAENLRDNYQRHEPEQVPEEPEELAEQYICKYDIYEIYLMLRNWFVIQLI